MRLRPKDLCKVDFQVFFAGFTRDLRVFGFECWGVGV